MDKTEALRGAKKLNPLEMNKLVILKDHTVITFAPGTSAENATEV